MPKEVKKKSTSKPGKKGLDKALMKVFDVMSSLNVKFILLGQTAKDVHDAPFSVWGGSLTGDKVEVGVEERYLTGSVRRLLRDGKPVYIKGAHEKNGKIDISHENTPIEIKVVKNKYEFFKNLDMKPYMTGHFHLPNPFEKYWKARNLVK